MDITNLTRIPSTIRNIQRFRQILVTVAKYGFDDVVLRLGVESYIAQAKHLLRIRVAAPEPVRYTTEERIRMILEELGPTFIKFGQILATRPDLIPMSLVAELRKLQDEVPPFPGAQAKARIEQELGRPISELFAGLDEKPLAAASIAQVHRATLKTGEPVVVKVQRPGIEKTIEADLDILRILADMIAANIAEARQFDPKGLVEEFSRSIQKEIDFGREAGSLQRFADNFKDDPHVHVPRLYPEYSTTRVLTMEFIDGIKGGDFAEMDRRGLDRKQLAKVGTETVLKMIFVDGFFHADPHPGNLFILEGNVVCFIDYGMMGTVDSERIDELLVFLVSILTNDMDKMVGLFHRLGIIDETVNVRTLKSECQAILDGYAHLPLKSIDITKFITDVFEVIHRHRVIIPSDLLLMAKAVTTMEGIAQNLDPDYDPITAMRGFLLGVYVKRLTDPAYVLKGVYRTIDSYLYFLRKLPNDLDAIVTKTRRGELTIRTQDVDGQARIEATNRAANRLALALVIVGLMIGSTFLFLGNVGPSLANGVRLCHALGVLGFGVAAALGAALGIGILRSNLF